VSSAHCTSNASTPGATSPMRTPGRSPITPPASVSILAEWSRAEIATPAKDAGKPVASDDKEVRHDR
jgi:hypothetical protein